jgi:hypothetical protein
MPGSRGIANFVMKCAFCGDQGSVSFHPKSFTPATASDPSELVSQVLATLECRGLEIVGWAAGVYSRYVSFLVLLA